MAVQLAASLAGEPRKLTPTSVGEACKETYR